MKRSKSYNDYKKARDKSWEIIFKYGVKVLPVDMYKLLKKMKIKLISYSKGEQLIRILHLEQSTKNDGFTAVVKNKYVVFYDDSVINKGRITFTLAHELGHIVLGHVKTATVWNRGEDKPVSPEEVQANIFASRLLAPACMLHELNIHTAEEISSLCGLSKSAAKIRAERMEQLYAREAEWQRERGKSCFGTSPEECKALKQFEKFCKQYIAKEGVK